MKLSCFPADVPYVFAYGSLVNPHARPRDVTGLAVRLRGFSRNWNHVVELDGLHVRALSISEREGGEVLGEIILHEDMVAFDRREVGYRREVVDTARLDLLCPGRLDREVHVYRSANGLEHEEAWILASYVLVVLHGYYIRFGELGVRNLLDACDSWHFPLLWDCHAPVYPRYYEVPNCIVAFFRAFAEDGCSYIKEIK